MSDNKALTQLPAGGAISGTEKVLAVQSGADVTLTPAQFLTYVQSSLTTALIVGTTTVTGGTTGRVLYDNGGILGEYTVTGTAGSIVLSVSPTFTGSPVLSTPTATTLNVSGAVVGASFYSAGGDGVSGVGGILFFVNNNTEMMRLVSNVLQMGTSRIDFGSAVGAGDVSISRFGTNLLQVGTTAANALGAFAPQTKAGAFVAGDFPSGGWYVGRDTVGTTTKLYYNNAGVLMAVALA